MSTALLDAFRKITVKMALSFSGGFFFTNHPTFFMLEIP